MPPSKICEARSAEHHPAADNRAQHAHPPAHDGRHLRADRGARRGGEGARQVRADLRRRYAPALHERLDRLHRASHARADRRAARRHGRIHRLERRRRRRQRTGPVPSHADQAGRRVHRRLHRHLAAGPRRVAHELRVHRFLHLRGAALRHRSRHPEQRRLLPTDHRDRARRHVRQRALPGRARRPRSGRLPHPLLGAGRAREAVARPRCRLRRRLGVRDRLRRLRGRAERSPSCISSSTTAPARAADRIATGRTADRMPSATSPTCRSSCSKRRIRCSSKPTRSSPTAAAPAGIAARSASCASTASSPRRRRSSCARTAICMRAGACSAARRARGRVRS